jgi:hypothetical protein
VLRTPQPTPRSAPTLSFESAMLAPTEQTDVAPAPRRRVVLAGVGVVALAVSLLAVRGLRQDTPPIAPPPAPAVATQTPPATIAPAVITTPAKKPAVLVDSAARARSAAARRQRRDSAISANRAAATIAQPVRDAIGRYARAIEEKRVDKLREAYPGLTSDQQTRWETGVFAIANAIKASVTYNTVVMHKDGADVDFTLTLSYDYPGSTGSLPRMKQHALLEEKDGVWQIREIK